MSAVVPRELLNVFSSTALDARAQTYRPRPHAPASQTAAAAHQGFADQQTIPDAAGADGLWASAQRVAHDFSQCNW